MCWLAYNLCSAPPTGGSLQLQAKRVEEKISLYNTVQLLFLLISPLLSLLSSVVSSSVRF